MKTRDNWRKKAKKANDPLSWTAYRYFRQEEKQEIRNTEQEFVAEQIQRNPNNTNNIWKAIRHCIPNKSTSQRIFRKNDKTVADEFRSPHYSSLFVKALSAKLHPWLMNAT